MAIRIPVVDVDPRVRPRAANRGATEQLQAVIGRVSERRARAKAAQEQRDFTKQMAELEAEIRRDLERFRTTEEIERRLPAQTRAEASLIAARHRGRLGEIEARGDVQRDLQSQRLEENRRQFNLDIGLRRRQFRTDASLRAIDIGGDLFRDRRQLEQGERALDIRERLGVLRSMEQPFSPVSTMGIRGLELEDVEEALRRGIGGGRPGLEPRGEPPAEPGAGREVGQGISERIGAPRPAGAEDIADVLRRVRPTQGVRGAAEEVERKQAFSSVADDVQAMSEEEWQSLQQFLTPEEIEVLEQMRR